jgi:hypothetical protein
MASISQLTARLVDLFGAPGAADPTKLMGNLQVSPNGNILVGSSTDSGTGKLQVTGSLTVTAGAIFGDRPTWAKWTPWDNGNFDPSTKLNAVNPQVTGRMQVIGNGTFGEIALRSTDGSWNYMRGRSGGGGMEWVNHAYNSVVGTMDDGGNIQFGAINSRGRITANEHLFSLNNVYTGNGASYMGTDGNLYGGVWGGWLSSWVNGNFATNGKVDGNWNNQQNAINNKANGSRYTFSYDGGQGRTNFVVDATLVAFLQNNVSDMRLKSNIKVADRDALSRINRVKFYEFEWKEDGRHEDFGYVAQQLRAVDPRYVHAPTAGEDPLTTPLGFNDQTLLRDALRAIQQLSARVSQLETTPKTRTSKAKA